ncbi:MAG: DUF6064 family protein [Methanomicrobiaceae archaeon]|nr:DUF6064 family protein [Methanomicrobiaceae archaeon]
MFYTQFSAYNTDLAHCNAILWLLLVPATVTVLARPGDERSNMLAKEVLALVFLWNGLIFFFQYMIGPPFRAESRSSWQGSSLPWI